MVNEPAHEMIFLGIRCNSDVCSQYLPNLFGANLLKIEIATFKGFERALVLALIASAIFFAEMVFVDMIHFQKCFRYSLPMLRCAQKSVDSVAFKKSISNAWLISDMVFDAASLVEPGFMIGGFK